MADQANNFGPLTDEQRAALQRQAISTEALNPLDFIGPGAIGMFGGRMLGRGAAHVAETGSNILTPNLSAAVRYFGYNPAATVNKAGAYGGGAGGLLGLLSGLMGPSVRDSQNTARDAEGQPGGFYGQPMPTSRDAEGQPGGFYGNYAESPQQRIARQLMQK